MLKFPARQLNKVERQLESAVAHFEKTQEGLGIAHLQTEPVLFVFKTPVTEIQLSVTLNFNFRFVTAGSDEADYLLHDLSLRCEPLEIEYDDYMTYYYSTELDSELPSLKRRTTTPNWFFLVINPERTSSKTSKGVDQKRLFKLSGDELTLTNPTPSTGSGTGYSVWKRVR